MVREIQVNEATAEARRVYFQLVDATDGITAETGEAGGQPQIVDGAAWTNTGIGVLVAIGFGRYYAELTLAAVSTTGRVIETRYKSAATAECRGDTVVIVSGTGGTLTINAGAGVPTAPLVAASQTRGFTKDVVILDVNSDAIVPLAGDILRAYIGREGELGTDLADVALLVTSTAATANGSSFTKNSPASGSNRLRLDASDLTFAPGIYTLFIDFYDSNDANEWKVCSREIFFLERT